MAFNVDFFVWLYTCAWIVVSLCLMRAGLPRTELFLGTPPTVADSAIQNVLTGLNPISHTVGETISSTFLGDKGIFGALSGPNIAVNCGVARPAWFCDFWHWSVTIWACLMLILGIGFPALLTMKSEKNGRYGRVWLFLWITNFFFHLPASIAKWCIVGLEPSRLWSTLVAQNVLKLPSVSPYASFQNPGDGMLKFKSASRVNCCLRK